MRQNSKNLLAGPALALALAYRLVAHRLSGHRPRSGATEGWSEQRMRQARPAPTPDA